MPADWAAVLAGWSVADTASWLHSLPSALQQQLHAQLPTGGGLPPPPWDAAAGSVPDLLTELGSKLKPYAATLAEYEYERVAQLQALGRDGLREELRSLGVTPDHRDKLCSLAFTPRPCGSLGGAFSRDFLEVARPLHASHMGCENMGPMLYALVKFVKPGRVLEVGAGYTSLWLLQALVRVRVRVRVGVSVRVIGYTSLWLLQALRDNADELARCEAAQAADGYRVEGTPWLVDGAEDEDEEEAEAAGAGAGGAPTPRLSDDGVTPAGTRGWALRHGRGVLHCVDDCSHAHTTAHRVRRREPKPEREP